MEATAVATLIREKLTDGRLPHDSIPRVWGGPGAGEICDACNEIITKAEFVMEGVSMSLEKRAVQFHVQCFNLWDQLRDVPGR